MKEQTYYIEGMHCAACEVLIEKKLLEIPGVEAVDASVADGKAVIEYEGEKPALGFLNNIFKKDNYIFSENHNFVAATPTISGNSTLIGLAIAVSIIAVFLGLDRLGISGFLNINSRSSLFSFFGLGILAGLSSCAALVGGIVLSMAKQWNELYLADASSSKKLEPHILFNAGRIVSYAILGGVLGLIGSRLSLSFTVTAWLIIIVSLLMITLAFQMLDIKAFRKFQIRLPKSITRGIADEKKFQGRYMPFIMGAATFFLPCGFTITAQTIALLSANATQGALIMGLFALGTAPMLLLIGISSVKFLSKPHLALTFSKVAGFLVLFFALWNIYSQIGVLGFATGINNTEDLAPMVAGKQEIKMTVLAVDYSPRAFKVKAGIPVKWEITSSGQAGCASGAVFANGLVDNPIYLNPEQGQIKVVEFTPQNPGIYKFNCSMNMARGSIEVVN